MWQRFASGYCCSSPHKRISEVPRIILEHIVIDTESECLQPLHRKYGGSAGVTLTEGVYLPNARHELANLFHCHIGIEHRIIGFLLLLEVVFERLAQHIVVRIEHRVATQHPLLLCDIDIT